MASSTQVDAADLLNLLESSDLNVVKEIQELIVDNLRQSKEAWLLNSLVDSYMLSQSQQCLAILSLITEHHVKHLFDKLAEHLKGTNKLQVMTILGYLIQKQPSWLHSFVHHPLNNLLLKSLKTETDVPILMCGLLDLTSLLPLVPVAITPYLHDIFEVFLRISAFNLRKPGNVPDVYLLHLQVATYSLFHRLYGMYPCHFLTFLRAAYTRKENTQVFHDTIRPMLDTVRMHPLLVTATKDKEIATDRWRQLEVHDIMIECAKLSLDPIEGSSEEKHCPITSFYSVTSSNKVNSENYKHILGHTESAGTLSTRKPAPLPSPLFYARSDPVVNSVDPNTVWSPSSVCDMSTPPPRASVTPSEHLQGGTVISPLRTTPHGHYMESPLPTQSSHGAEEEKGSKAMQATPTSDQSKSKRKKRLSGITLSLAGKIPTPTEGTSLYGGDVPGSAGVGGPGSGSSTSSVPPSPMKPNFTAEPPFSAQPMQAIRKISFPPAVDDQAKDKDKVAEETSAHKTALALAKGGDLNLVIKPRATLASTDSPASMVTNQGTVATTTPPISAPLVTSSVAFSPLRTIVVSNTPLEDSLDTPSQHSVELDTSVKCTDTLDKAAIMTTEVPEVPSVSQLPNIIDYLDVSHEEIDKEVLALTTGGNDALSSAQSDSSGSPTPSHLPSEASLTAASVKAFMKKVNRIRFNTVNIINKDQEGDKILARPRSCPDFDPTEAEDRGVSQRSTSSLPRERSRTNGKLYFSSKPSEKKVEFSVAITSNTSSVGKMTKSLNSTASQTSFCLTSEGGLEAIVEAQDWRHYFPYEHLFPLALPYGPLLQCYNCTKSKREGEEKISDEKVQGKPVLPAAVIEPPLFSSYSPADLLDRHLERGCEVHAKQVTNLPLPSKAQVSWTHFGGGCKPSIPPADEVNILRGQILLLQNQLMFERSRRELHAKRNRRLLGRIVNTTTLEEKNVAMKDQLRLQETEIQHLNSSLGQLRENLAKLRSAREGDSNEHKEAERILKDEVELLQKKNKELEAQLEKREKENTALNKDLQQCKSQVYNLEQKLEVTKSKADTASSLKLQMSQLNKELVLMGELQMKYQERLRAATTTTQPSHKMGLMYDTCKHETIVLAQKLENSLVQLEATKSHVTDLEEQLKIKEAQINELKKAAETVQTAHKYQLKAVEDKYECVKRIEMALQAQILELYHQVAQAHKPERPAPPQRAASGGSEAQAQAACEPEGASVGEPITAEAPASSQGQLVVTSAIDSDTEEAVEATSGMEDAESSES